MARFKWVISKPDKDVCCDLCDKDNVELVEIYGYTHTLLNYIVICGICLNFLNHLVDNTSLPDGESVEGEVI